MEFRSLLFYRIAETSDLASILQSFFRIVPCRVARFLASFLRPRGPHHEGRICQRRPPHRLPSIARRERRGGVGRMGGVKPRGALLSWQPRTSVAAERQRWGRGLRARRRRRCPNRVIFDRRDAPTTTVGFPSTAERPRPPPAAASLPSAPVACELLGPGADDGYRGGSG
jgi:hypothetical protein